MSPGDVQGQGLCRGHGVDLVTSGSRRQGHRTSTARWGRQLVGQVQGRATKYLFYQSVWVVIQPCRGLERLRQEVAIFRQTAANSRQRRYGASEFNFTPKFSEKWGFLAQFMYFWKKNFGQEKTFSDRLNVLCPLCPPATLPLFLL